MADIAAKAGVARSTVSHVLTDYQHKSVRISDATRQRVLDAAAELGYRPNQLARSVAIGKTRMVGYLVEEPYYEPYWNTILGALAEAEDQGFALKVLSVTPETLIERVHQCVEFRLSGLIVRLISDKSIIFEEALRAQIPVVSVDEGNPQPFGTTVSADDETGCRAAIEHLMGLGHTRIGFISSGFPYLVEAPSGVGDIGSAREALFRHQMKSHGLSVPEGYVVYETMAVFGPDVENEDNDHSVLDAIDNLLAHPQGRPTAILCWRDETAMVAIRACRKHGLRIPEDISVVGFSDIRAARFYDPPLSTIKSPWEGLGRLAMRQIARSAEEKFDPKPMTLSVDTAFVARRSTGPVSSQFPQGKTRK